MAQRSRTAKTLAQRIDLSYFKNPHPLRHWKFIVSAAVPALAILWIGALAVAGSRTPFSSGPLAAAHHLVSDTCERCHVRAAGAFSARVTDASCLSCHGAPAHADNQAFTPPCSSCHTEHRGAVRLAATDDVSCLQCHRDLTTRSVAPAIVRTIGSFSDGHPAFALHRNGVRDEAALRFNHAVHLKEDLRGATGPVTLSCTTCHKPDAPGRSMGGRDRNRRSLMQPITFQRDCSYCHALYFDPAIDAQVPHDKTEVVHQFVDAALRAYIAENPQQVGLTDQVRGRIPVNFPDLPAPAAARTAAEWVTAREAAVEDYLWTKTCAECHLLTSSSDAIVRTVPTAMRRSWMPGARFDHTSHQMAACQSCHANAMTSTDTSDVLLPPLQTCQHCHGEAEPSADTRCFVCHDYHDWTKPTATPAGFEIEQLAR